jgi:outer membrane protein assembly factor BamD (BamD/ComL family)
VHTRTAHDPASTPTPTPRPPPTPRHHLSPRTRSPEPAPTSQPTGDLARQLEQVRAAGEAVRTGDGAAALAAADAYLRTHPTGTFAPEARLHRAAALCLLGQVDEAREAAAAFARDYPTSPLRPRVAAVCDH